VTRALPPQPSACHAAATIRRRIAAAWRALRGLDPVAGRAGVEVPVSQLRDAVECILAGAGLPYDWAAMASSDDLKALANAIAAARLVRSAELADPVGFCSSEVRS
jgi:hypothetical protein